MHLWDLSSHVKLLVLIVIGSDGEGFLTQVAPPGAAHEYELSCADTGQSGAHRFSHAACTQKASLLVCTVW